MSDKRTIWGKVGALLASLAGLLLFFWRPADGGRPAPCKAERLGRNWGQLARWGIAFLLVTGVLLATAWGTLLVAPQRSLAGNEPLHHSGQRPAMPRLPDEVAATLAAQRAAQAAHLRRYGWVDRGAGLVHLPIERAMERLVEEAGDDGAIGRATEVD